MLHYVGLDVSSTSTSVCVVDDQGAIVRETSLVTEVGAIADYLFKLKLRFGHVGLEAGSTGEWLCDGLADVGLPAVAISAVHAHAVLKQKINKTDKNDARGIADIMRAGIFRAVHMKSARCQQLRDLLTARRLLLAKAVDLESAIAGILRGYGIRVASSRVKSFDATVHAAIAGSSHLKSIMGPLLTARAALRAQFSKLDRAVVRAAGADLVCRRLMTVPGVGPIVSVTYRTVIDTPARFPNSRMVAAHVGLTPRTRQSGKMDYRGRISRCGNKPLRAALYNAALVILMRSSKTFALRTWALEVAARRGRKKAAVALARRLCVVLHAMWKQGEDFRLGVEGA
jgi:transposase